MLDSGNLLAEKYRESYEYCAFKKVPAAWHKPFQKSAGLGAFAKAKSEYLW
jgi:hypothetical protein